MQRDDDVEIPSLTLDQDEVSERRPSIKTEKTRTAPSPTRPAHAPTVVHKKTSLTGVYLLLMLILSASMGVGYWLWLQNMQLRNELYGAKSEIKNLDHQLLAADVSADKQGETLEEILKKHESEIRKLWGVSYDTNRKAIAANKSVASELDKKLLSLKDSVSTQSKLIAIQSDAFNDVEAGYNKLIPSVASLEEKVEPLPDRLSQLTIAQEIQAKQLASTDQKVSNQAAQYQAQKTSLDQLSKDLANLQNAVAAAAENTKVDTVNDTALADVQSTLSKHQDAINSSDAFRTQVNAEIIRLRKQINQLMLEQQLNAQP
ncbi:hypothetical protein [Marinomonas transparens]|uniref:Uncharacterized protein n=1 Tax=Marinomonas transparens TaxID=2795388 RepID=A0A934MWH9_9GAMM|nr:hypothetical protein [Marinomonas transparens]MBJ7538179.1 hypothetical protein [Marinomonas transparens]